MAEKMMAKRNKKVNVESIKEGSAQRSKLKMVAKKMNAGTKSKGNEIHCEDVETKRGSFKERSRSLSKEREENKRELRRSKRSSRRISLVALESLPSVEKVTCDSDESSVSTYTTLETSMNNSYNGSLEVSSVSLLSSSLSNNGSSLSRMLGNSTSDGLDCSFFLIISAIWETVKRIDGYAENLAEHVICRMMTLEPELDIRQELGMKSFRSSRFDTLSRKLIDVVEILVTMIGPDIDDDELLDIGNSLRMEGVRPTLFGRAIALALRDLLGEKEFPKDDFDAWRNAFVFVTRKMDKQ